MYMRHAKNKMRRSYALPKNVAGGQVISYYRLTTVKICSVIWAVTEQAAVLDGCQLQLAVTSDDPVHQSNISVNRPAQAAPINHTLHYTGC